MTSLARYVALRAGWPARLRRLTSHGVLLAIVAPFSARALTAQQSNAKRADAESMQKIERRFAATPNVSLRMSGSVGTIRVTGWDKDSVLILATIPKSARFELSVGGDGRAPAAGAKMYIESSDDQSVASGVFELRLPKSGRAWIKSGTANIDASDFSGGLDLNTIGGSVRVTGSPRELQVEAMDAAVSIDGSPPWLRVKTATGDITLRGSSGDAVLSSISGMVRTDGGTLERARVETVTGGVILSTDLAAGGDVAVESHSGTVELRLPSKGEFEVSASTVTGSIDNRFDYHQPKPGREGRGQELEIGRGMGRARTTVRTFKGTIVLSRR